eukprot:11028611-Karenia_brevis.AAC.1
MANDGTATAQQLQAALSALEALQAKAKPEANQDPTDSDLEHAAAAAEVAFADPSTGATGPDPWRTPKSHRTSLGKGSLGASGGKNTTSNASSSTQQATAPAEPPSEQANKRSLEEDRPVTKGEYSRGLASLGDRLTSGFQSTLSKTA